MKSSYDPEQDILYIHLEDGPSASVEEIEDNIIIEKNESGNVMGIEIWRNEYITVIPRTILLEDRKIITLEWSNVCKTDEPLFRLYVPPTSISADKLRLGLKEKGFTDVGLSVCKGEKYSLRKILVEPWELHMRIFADGFIEAEVEIKREYLEHLEPRRCIILYEAYQAYADIYPNLHILHTPTGKWITGILEHYQVCISPPRGLTPWKPMVAITSIIGTIGLIAFALNMLNRPAEVK